MHPLSLPRQYDMYQRLQLQFYIPLMMGARNIQSNLAVNKYLLTVASCWIPSTTFAEACSPDSTICTRGCNYILILCFRADSISQMKHQLDATLCRFYFCRVTLHVSGASAHYQEYLKLVQRPLVHVLSLQVSHHISLLGPKGPNKEM